MLQRIAPEQVNEIWGDIAELVRRTFPPYADDTEAELNNVLAEILAHRMQCWVGQFRGYFTGVVLTEIFTDTASGTRSLVIYALSLVRGMSDEEWQSCMDSVLTFARRNNCTKITSLTRLPEVVKRAKSLGWNTDTTFMFKEV